MKPSEKVQLFRNHNGQEQAVFQGYSFILETFTLQGIKKVWHCDRNGCQGRLHTKRELVLFASGHNHQSDPNDLKTKMAMWDVVSRDMLAETPVAKKKGKNVLKSVIGQADLLYKAVYNAPSSHWPLILEIIQKTMNRVAEHMTDGSVSCVQIIPVDSSSCSSQLLTLRDMVLNMEMGGNQMKPTSASVRPCSVVVDKLNEKQMFGLLQGKGAESPDSFTGIKQEIPDSEDSDVTPTNCITIAPSESMYVPTKHELDDGEGSSSDDSLDGGADEINHVEKDSQPDYDNARSEGPPLRRRSTPRLDYNENLGESDDQTIEEESANRSRHHHQQPVVISYYEAEDGDNDSPESDDEYGKNSDDDWQPLKRKKQPSGAPLSRSSRMSRSSCRDPERRGQYQSRNARMDQYEHYDLDAGFEEGVDTDCFLCQTTGDTAAFQVQSLRHFVKHATNAGHVQYRKPPVRLIHCPVCKDEIRTRIFTKDGPEEVQVIRLACKVLHHMKKFHGYETEKAFLPRYKCKVCIFSTHDSVSFLEHVMKSHRFDTPSGSNTQSRKGKNRYMLLRKYEEYDINAPYAESVDSLCPFCPRAEAQKSASPADFLQHLQEKKHLVCLSGVLRMISCPVCQMEMRTRIYNFNGPENNQILRLVGKVIAHMVDAHGYNPAQSFIHLYQCDMCDAAMYAWTDFLQHLTKSHYLGKKPRDEGEEEDNSGSSDNLPRVSNDSLETTLENSISYEIDTVFKNDTKAFCPFCPENDAFKSSTLRDFIGHLEHAKHINTEDNGVYSMVCCMCEEKVNCRIQEKIEPELLRLVGHMMQHSHDVHGVSLSPDFIPLYFCDQCDYSCYSDAVFMEHVISNHLEEDANKNDSDKAKEADLPRNFPENEVNTNQLFSKDIDTSCPFCRPDDAYKSESIADFLKHISIAQHLRVARNCSTISCPECTEEFKGRIFVNFGSKAEQTLRLLGKVLHHLFDVHGRRFTEGFLPVYACNSCDYSTYSGKHLVDHRRITHRNMSKQPPPNTVVKRREKSEEVSSMYDSMRQDIELMSLPLGNDIFEDNTRTTFSLDERLKAEFSPACPLCPSDSPFTFKTFGEFADHCVSAQHVRLEAAFVTMLCTECKATIATKKFKKDNMTVLAVSAIGKWAEHRCKMHNWVPPDFFPLFRCPLCQVYQTRSSRLCYGHVHTPGRCRTNRKRSFPTDNDEFQCPTCNKFFNRKAFSGHVQMCSKPDSERKRTKCPVCGKLFLDELPYHKNNLKNHIAIVHGDAFPHLCAICSTQFKRRNDLNRHMLSAHDMNISKKKTLFCDKCSYKTLTISHLERHKTKHNEGNEVTCHYCGKQYRSEYHLKNHIEDVHATSTQLFRCTQCTYTTSSRRYLQKHVRWHYNTKAGAGHWCTICNYNARFPSVLRYHMKNVHKIDVNAPGADQVSYKSVVMKRRYKNKKLPGEQETVEKMFVSLFPKRTDQDTEPIGQDPTTSQVDMNSDNTCTRKDRVTEPVSHRKNPNPVKSKGPLSKGTLEPESGGYDSRMSALMMGSHMPTSDCSTSSAAASSAATATLTTTGGMRQADGIQMRPMDTPMFNINHQQMPVDLGGPMQGNEYMQYNPAMFPMFPPPHGLPPQYF